MHARMPLICAVALGAVPYTDTRSLVYLQEKLSAAWHVVPKTLGDDVLIAYKVCVHVYVRGRVGLC